jgi:hypothetical protein
MSELQHLPKKPENALFDKLKTASLKHQEILQHLANKTKGEDRKTFLTVLDFSKRNLATIDKYAKKNPMTWTDWTK